MQVKINLPLLEDIKDDIDFCCKLAKEESMIILPGEIILESIHQAFVTLVNNCHYEKKALLRQKILNFSFSSSRVKRLPFIHHSHMNIWIFLWKPPSVPPRNLGRKFSASPENTALIYSCACCFTLMFSSWAYKYSSWCLVTIRWSVGKGKTDWELHILQGVQWDWRIGFASLFR